VKVLVAGATGYLGRYVVKVLKEHGHWVRVLTRRTNALSKPGAHMAPEIKLYTDDVFEGQITQPATLKGVCDGVDYVFSSIGITRQNDRVTYKDVDYQGNVNLLIEAEKNQIAGFMYIGVFKGNQMGGLLNESKEMFIDRLKHSTLHHVVVRPTGYYSDMEEFLRMAIQGRVYLIGDGTKQMNPIHGADLAEFCAENLSKGNLELDIGGPQVLSHRDIARLAFQASGKSQKISTIQPWVIKSAIWPLKFFSPNNFGAIEFLYNAMTHDLIAPVFGTRDLLSHFNEVVAKQ
jgi:uncharacterized protein YbjT (DUF2867 family)